MSAPSYVPTQNVGIQAGGNEGNPLLQKGSKVDLKLTGYQLPSISTGAPDAFAVVFYRNFGKTDWIEISRSETIKDSNPSWQKLFSLEYHFAIYQEVRIVLFDRSTESGDLRQQRLIGVADCTLGKILSARGNAIELCLTNVEHGPNSSGKVLVSAEAVLATRKNLILDLAVSELLNVNEFSKQANYVQQLGIAANTPTSTPKLARRGVDAARGFIGRLKKDENFAKPAALPAHLENQYIAAQQQQNLIQQQYVAASRTPPPFSPYIIISRAPDDASTERDYHANTITWQTVYRSPPAEQHDLAQPCVIRGIQLKEHDLCEGNENRLLKISCHRTSGDTLIGEVVTTLYALRRLVGTTTVGSAQQLEMKPAGKLALLSFTETEQDSFMDYVRSGRCDFSLICAVDFTSSNGDPTMPGTCHYISPPGAPPAPNQYEAAMRTVGSILASYSSSPTISAFGFGANLPPKFDTSFCFPMSESVHSVGDVNGMEELIKAYKSTLAHVQLAGPTIFSKVLQTAGTITSRRVEAANRSGSTVLPYSILLILTDGVISDFDAALAQLIALSELPISVIIVGIGGEDFRKMQMLDEGKPLRRGTMTASRDIVQFVPFRNFQGDPAALAEAVLSRLPEQVMSYVSTVQNRTPKYGATFGR